MRIKDKLAVILGLIGVILAFWAGFVVWNARQITGQVQSVASAIDHLKTMGEVRSRFYNQMHMLVHYFAYHEEQGRTKYEALKQEVFPLLKSSPKGAPGKQEPGDIEKTYGQLTAVIERILSERDQGRTGQARAFPGDEIEPHMNAFLNAIENDIFQRTEDIEADYDRIVMRLGGIPTMGEASLRRVEGARLSIRYFLAVDALSRAMNRQVHELVDYLVSGSDRNLRELTAADSEATSALEKCRRIITTQIGLGVEGEEEQFLQMEDLEREYRGTMLLARDAVILKKGGMTGQAFALLEEKLKRRVDDRLLPRIDRIMDGSREEVAEVNRSMLNAVFVAAMAAMVVISLCALALFVASQRLIRALVDAIYRLKTGAGIVGSGDLDHRIEVRSRDELGELAESFNKMTASLKESDEELKSFIFSLSHDLRSPLVNLKGFSDELARSLEEIEALLRQEGGALTEDDSARLLALLRQEVPPMLGFIESASDRMGELINAVLKLSRASHMPLRPEMIDMTALVREALKPHEEQINAGRITVSVGALPQLLADRQAVELVVRNLLDNAIKYRAPERAGRVEITGERQTQDTVFHVRDNGRGIAPEDRQKAFDMFRRVGQRDVPGEGMGLAYARTLVRRHGGRIWCESEPGAGSTFSFAIPHPAPRQ